MRMDLLTAAVWPIQGSWLAETNKIISQRQGDRATLTVLFILKHTKIPNTLQKILHWGSVCGDFAAMD